MSAIAETKLTTLEEIEAAVAKLSNEQLSAFRNWFDGFDADAWDRQFEKDALSGALDAAIGDEVRKAWREGRCAEM